MRTFALAAAFVAGAGACHVLEPAARGAVPPAATVYVPVDGLVFRAADGRTIARLGYDAKGGFFDLYDTLGGRTCVPRGVSVKNPYDLGF